MKLPSTKTGDMRILKNKKDFGLGSKITENLNLDMTFIDDKCHLAY
jgi:hypothetical protein